MMGFALLWALSYLYSFLAQAAGDAQSVIHTDVALFAATVGGCLLAMLANKHAGSGMGLSAIAMVSCALMLVGVILTAGCAYIAPSSNMLLFAKASLGFGQGLLYVLWGIAISTREVEQIEYAFLGLVPTVSVILIAFVVIRQLCSSMWVVGVVYICILPVFSASLLITSERSANATTGIVIEAPVNAEAPTKSIVAIFISLAILFASMSLIWVVNLGTFMLDFSHSALAYALGAAVAFALIWASLRWTKRFDMSTITRWNMPVAILGAFFASIGGTLLAASQICFIAINVGLELLGRLLVIHTAKRSPSLRGRICAIGFAAIPLGGMLGGIAWSTLQTLVTPLPSYALILAALVPFAAVCATVGWGESKLGQPTASNPGEPIASATSDPFGQACRTLCEKGGLSTRESEVFELLAQGRSRTYIRESLFISKGTVDTHITHIYRKLGVTSKDGLMALVDETNARHKQQP